MTVQIAKYEAETRAVREEVHELKTKASPVTGRGWGFEEFYDANL